MNSLPGEDRRRLMRRWRAVKDYAARYGVTAAGVGVVIALALICLYLLVEVAPLFFGAGLEKKAAYRVGGGSETVMLAMERYQEVGLSLGADGRADFFEVEGGKAIKTARVAMPSGVEAVSFAEAGRKVAAWGLSDGTAVIVKPAYSLSYPNDKRHIDASLEYPLGETPIVIDSAGSPISSIAVQESPEGVGVVAETADGRLLLAVYTVTESFFGDIETDSTVVELPRLPGRAFRILLDITMRSLFVADASGRVHYYDVSDLRSPRLVQSVRVVDEGSTISKMEFLLGTVSVIVGSSDGKVSQWFLVRDDDNNYQFTHIRDFKPHSSRVTAIVPEYSRKGFITGDASGVVQIHYPTSSSTVLTRKVSDAAVMDMALSPVNNVVVVLDSSGSLTSFALRNRHPEVSFPALWSKVWYEGRSAPEYIWQSSSATDDFEPKLSMVPLSIGTLKAAVFSMLIAMPLALLGAVYTAYFLSPRFRGMVKPTIEVMEALPTVILGFLAGLWLAPFVESNLPAVFGVLVFIPLGVLIVSFACSRLPKEFRHRLAPPGWEAVWLLPLVILVIWLCVELSPLTEVLFFRGSARQWLTDMGITYDQRNALVVGFAMGFAVIPTIFSIAEDAVFNVPRHLTQGSLALGATPWQTVSRVVLHTASPGIFSAVMIGFGRAVGETMIVLMATGNSPVVNFNIFEGMRTLSANIAVELPETAVASTHYRVLFLAALVLFAFTFVVNTLAEVVRQRLRKKYASL